MPIGNVVGNRIGVKPNPFESNLTFYAPLRSGLNALVGTTPTLARATSGYYRDTGKTVKSAATNKPRFEAQGLLIESTTAQILEHTDDLSDAEWAEAPFDRTTTNIDTPTQDGTLAPDGTATAWKVTATGSGAAFAVNCAAAATANSGSVWLKKGNTTAASLEVTNFITSRGSIAEITLTDDWQYFSIDASAVVDCIAIYLNNNMSSGSAAAGDYIYVWGPNLQETASPTSTILDGATPADRQDDILTIATGQVPAANSAFAIGFTMTRQHDTGVFQTVMRLQNETNPRTVIVTSSGAVNAKMGASNDTSATTPFSDGGPHRILLTGDATTLKCFVDGVQVTSSAHGGTATTTDTEIQFNDVDNAFVLVRDVALYNKYFSTEADAFSEYLAHTY